MSITRQILQNHLVKGELKPGTEIGIRIDQTLTQDATGTLVMLELEALKLDRVRTEVSVQYVDHNLLQEDNRNPDDHLFLESACRRFGIWFSRAGNGISHVVHQERFGLPGKTLLGSDSHTPAAGALGMLAIGAGGVEVALAMAGKPFYVEMPKIFGIELTGRLPDWVSAKDVVLELLRRHGVRGGRGFIFEYYGPGVSGLSVMDRHVIANMGTELGATSSIFPPDDAVYEYLRAQQREYEKMEYEHEADFDEADSVDLTRLEPLIAMPSSPGNVKRVAEVAGSEIYQSYIGSSANPGYRDFAVCASIVKGRQIPPQVSFDVNPSSRQVLATLERDGFLFPLIAAGARFHQTGCNGCIGMGQAPATGKISLRTVPRNFPGRSGTPEDSVYLVSPETAAASAVFGRITDPRTLTMPYPRIKEPDDPVILDGLLEEPLPSEQAAKVSLVRGPNITKLPDSQKLADAYEIPVLLKTGDDVSTDEILPAGAKILPLRSNIPEISAFAFHHLDPDYVQRARNSKGETLQHVIVAGENYGQGSSREHAALAPRYLGLVAVIAKSFARIHWQNLINFGVVPLTFSSQENFEKISQGDFFMVRNLRQTLADSHEIEAVFSSSSGSETTCVLTHQLSERQVDILLGGGIINWLRDRI